MDDLRMTPKAVHLISYYISLLIVAVFSAQLFANKTPCQTAWEQMPEQFKQKITVGGLSLEPEKAFITKCQEYEGQLTTGESATIIKEMKGILKKAQKRLNAFLGAKKEIEEKPDVPYTQILTKYGFSGEWLDKFKGYEHKIRSFNTKYNAQEILTTTVAAFQTNDPKEKIRSMLTIMDSMSSAASKSNLPIVSLIGDIINGMVKVSQEMLNAVLNLRDVLKKRAGFCIGTGAAGDELPDQLLQKQGILACPLAYDTLPLKNIYETVIPTQGTLLFWVDNHFIEGKAEGGSKAGLNQALSLMNAAKELGYAVDTNNINTIANVYNIPGGIPKLMDEARETILGIKNKADMLDKVIGSSGECAKENIIKHIESMTNFQLALFQNEDVAKLITTYAASFVAQNGGFGSGGSARSSAYTTYQAIWQHLKNITLINLYGTIKDRKNPTCPACANATVETHLTDAEEVHGCEITHADNNGNFAMHLIVSSPSAAAQLLAITPIGNSESQTIALSANAQSITLYIDNKNEVDCQKVNALIEQAKTAHFNNDPVKAHALIDQARTLHCDSSKDELDKLAGLIDKNDVAAQAAEDGLTCDENKIQITIADPNITPSKKAQLETLLTAINQANSLLKTSISSDSQLSESITSHQSSLDAIKQCTVLRESLQKSLALLIDLQQQVHDAEQVKSTCELQSIMKTAAALERFQQPLSIILQRQLEERANQIKAASNDYSNAIALYKQGQAEPSLSSLLKIKQTFSQLECKDKLVQVEHAIDIVKQMLTAQKDPHKALASCYPAIIEQTLISIKDKPEYAGLEQQLLTVNAAVKQLKQAGSLLKQGELDNALNLINTAKESIPGICPQLHQHANTLLQYISKLQKEIMLIEQTLKECDIPLLKTLQSKLSTANPSLSLYIPKIESAIKQCEQTTALNQCVKLHGINASVSAIGKEYSCVCKTGSYLANNNQCLGDNSSAQPENEGNLFCRKKFGAAFLFNTNPNGTYQCQCNTGYQFNKAVTQCIPQSINDGHLNCKKSFGDQAYAQKINENGTFQCACKSGYQFNTNFTHCNRQTLQDGHQQCQKSFGQGAAALKINANGSYECQCKKQYQWNKSHTQCVITTHKDGYQQCRAQFGAKSYPIRYLGNNRWSCYKPQATKPQAVKPQRTKQPQCPIDYYRMTKGGECVYIPAPNVLIGPSSDYR